MTINQMRDILKKVYPTGKWLKRLEAMPEKQVYAIYMNMLEAGKFDNKIVMPKDHGRTIAHRQMSMFNDIFK